MYAASIISMLAIEVVSIMEISFVVINLVYSGYWEIRICILHFVRWTNEMRFFDVFSSLSLTKFFSAISGINKRARVF